MNKEKKDELYLIIDFLEELTERQSYTEDSCKLFEIIEVIKNLIKE